VRNCPPDSALFARKKYLSYGQALTLRQGHATEKSIQHDDVTERDAGGLVILSKAAKPDPR
jgi:hypothetical protein